MIITTTKKAIKTMWERERTGWLKMSRQKIRRPCVMTV